MKNKIAPKKKEIKKKRILHLLRENKSVVSNVQKKNKLMQDQTIDWEERSNRLRENMLERIQSAKFRILNEKICKHSSNNIKSFFENNVADFKSYHTTYSSLQESWPEKPIDKIISYLKDQPASKIIADMGCGEGVIAQSVKNQVHSFDLLSNDENIIACNMSNVPLSNLSVDIVVFCLSLMGKEITLFITEANRILKKNGTLLIAELTSRFEKVTPFLKSMQNLGFKLIKKNQKNNCFWIFEFIKFSRPNPQAKLKLKPFLYKKR